jgi:hypothetical protein
MLVSFDFNYLSGCVSTAIGFIRVTIGALIVRFYYAFFRATIVTSQVPIVALVETEVFAISAGFNADT